MTLKHETLAARLSPSGRFLAIFLPLVLVALFTSIGGLWNWMLEPAKESHDVAASVVRIVAYGGGVAAIAASLTAARYISSPGKVADVLEGMAASLLLWSAVVIGLFSLIVL